MKLAKSMTVKMATACIVASLSMNALAKDLVILIDASQSNPLLVNTDFNQRAAQFAVNSIGELKQGDVVKIQTFGSLRSTSNFRESRLEVKRHTKNQVGYAVAKRILAVPDTLQGQGSTNALAWFGRNAFDCSREQHTILVITDAIEASEYVDPNKLLAGKQSLPKPDNYVRLKGCEVVFFGVGVGRTDTEAKRLREAWSQYFEQAGAKFNAVLL